MDCGAHAKSKSGVVCTERFTSLAGCMLERFVGMRNQFAVYFEEGNGR
jgi:hypothetical protein